MILTVVLIGVGLLLLAAVIVLLYIGTVTGALVIDTRWARRLQPLGPLSMDIAGDRQKVYGLLTQPYLGRPTHALADKVQVIERGSDLVVAAHRTPIGGRLVAVTVEAVRFTPTGRIDFRLLRGPVPHVVETFTLTDIENGCRLDYTGELGTDFGPVGASWGRAVARKWRATVRASMLAVKAEAERHANDGR
jgi:hypothetical protein